jgi:hypothetical protein
LGLAAKVWDGGVSVEPDVFQFVFGHVGVGLCGLAVMVILGYQVVGGVPRLPEIRRTG